MWFEPPIACRWETHTETLEAELADGVKPNAAPAATEATSAAAEGDTAVAGTTATPTEATPLSTNPQPSPLKCSPRGPAKLRSLKSEHEQTQKLHEISDFDLHAIPSNVDLYGLVKDFVVPRLPQGFCVRLEQQTPQSSSGQPQRKVMFLARQAHVRLGRGALDAAAMPEVSSLSLPTTSTSSTAIGADFLDMDEPAELFPPLCFDKLLKFRSQPRPPPVTPSSCYLFSQLIEDMDRLWQLQLPREQQEEMVQQISEQLSPNGSQHDETEELPEDMQPLSQELVEVLQPAAAAAAFAYYTGISFVRDSQLPAQPEPETSPKSAGSQDSSDDDDDEEDDSILELIEGAGNDSSAGATMQHMLSGNSNSENLDSEA